jgi:hypothetical protein
MANMTRELTYLFEIAVDLQNLLVLQNFRLKDADLTTKCLFSAVDMLQGKGTVQSVLATTPYVPEWDLLENNKMSHCIIIHKTCELRSTMVAKITGSHSNKSV